MTSVVCSVCSHKITAETDRIYCFGGCEQILHTRCSDISTAGATAIKENVAVKYFCFECRKKQISLNDVNKKCTELSQRFDAMHQLLVNLESNVSAVVEAKLNVLTNELLPSLLSDFKKEVVNVIRETEIHVSSDTKAKDTYADVVGGKKKRIESESGNNRPKQKDNNKDSDDEDGGLLRSGKRRIKEKRNRPVLTCRERSLQKY